MQYITSQFANPRGFVGFITGTIMAYENRERNRWAISLLELQRTDHVLELGFGPGSAIEQMAQCVTSGHVVGVDTSETMVQLASRRNATLIRAGRVELRQGSATAIPYPNTTFDKVLAVNSFQIWRDSLAGLEEIKRVLKPHGLVVITIQPVWDKSEAFARRTGDELLAKLSQAGFRNVHLKTKALKPMVVSGIGVR
jgi:ubiquinone/menaquinone biosynthesis C-methylase UbiE